MGLGNRPAVKNKGVDLMKKHRHISTIMACLMVLSLGTALPVASEEVETSVSTGSEGSTETEEVISDETETTVYLDMSGAEEWYADEADTTDVSETTSNIETDGENETTTTTLIIEPSLSYMELLSMSDEEIFEISDEIRTEYTRVLDWFEEWYPYYQESSCMCFPLSVGYQVGTVDPNTDHLAFLGIPEEMTCLGFGWTDAKGYSGFEMIFDYVVLMEFPIDITYAGNSPIQCMAKLILYLYNHPLVSHYHLSIPMMDNIPDEETTSAPETTASETTSSEESVTSVSSEISSTTEGSTSVSTSSSTTESVAGDADSPKTGDTVSGIPALLAVVSGSAGLGIYLRRKKE